VIEAHRPDEPNSRYYAEYTVEKGLRALNAWSADPPALGPEDGAVFAFRLAVSIHGRRSTPSFLTHGGGAEVCQSAPSARRASHRVSNPMPFPGRLIAWPLLPGSLPDGTRYGVRGGSGHRFHSTHP
jgi:hypothetical protein